MVVPVGILHSIEEDIACGKGIFAILLITELVKDKKDIYLYNLNSLDERKIGIFSKLTKSQQVRNSS